MSQQSRRPPKKAKDTDQKIHGQVGLKFLSRIHILYQVPTRNKRTFTVTDLTRQFNIDFQAERARF